MPSAAAPWMSRSQRRRPSRRKPKALLAGLLSPVLLAGPINPAAATIMQYKFSGEFSKTPKKGFDWLVGARLEGNMLWDSKANNGNGAFTDWNVKSTRSDWQKQQEQIGSQTSPEIDSKIRGLQTKISYFDNPELLNKALDNARKELDRTDGDEARKPVEANIKDLETFQSKLNDASVDRNQLKNDLQRELIQLNDSQFLYLQAKLNYIKNPELLREARDNAAADVTSAGSKESTLEEELNSLPQGIDVSGRPRSAVEQDLNSAQQIRTQAETRQAELNDLENKLKDATDVERESLKNALEGDLNLLRLQAKINYLDNPGFLAETLDQANEASNKTPGNITLASRFKYLENLNKQITENVNDPQSLKSELQSQLNGLRANQGLSGLSANPPRPGTLFELSRSANNSYCFASPVGPGAALSGGSFDLAGAGSSLCDGTNQNMEDRGFTAEEQQRNPVYFSVIQYFEIPRSEQWASFGFRLAFVPAGDNPSDKPGDNLALLGLDQYESRSGYGATFRFGQFERKIDTCQGSADELNIVASNGSITKACPFAPDEAGEVAGQPFLASLRLSSEVVGEHHNGGEDPILDDSIKNKPVCKDDDDDRKVGCRPSQAPAPLPILGAGAAFAWSRRVRRRYGLVVPATVAAGR